MKITRFDPNMATRPAPADGLVWYSPAEAPFRLTGFAWFDRDRLYRRLPRKAVPPLPASVDGLAWHTAGGQVAFRTDSQRIAIKVRTQKSNLFDHMTCTGLKGFDLYRGNPGQMQYAATTRFGARATAYDATLWNGERALMDTYTIDFPLYSGVKTVWIGLNKGARVLPPPPFASEDPVVFYGTSITQGGCANRPGMAFTNILSRRLNRPILNFGFSGSGKLEPEVGRHVADASTHPALFVIDADANCGPELLKSRLRPFIGILRQTHPRTPILVISRPPFASDQFQRLTHAKWALARRLQERTVRRLRDAGDRRVHFLDGFTLIPDATFEATVDGVHPTDLGFWQMARELEPVLRRLLR